MKDLVNHVRVDNPYRLGLKLNLDRSDLNVVQRNNRNDYEGELDGVFNLYLQQTEEPSWQQVVNALRAVGENKIAKSIMDKLGKVYNSSVVNFNTAFPSGYPAKGEAEPSVPPLKELLRRFIPAPNHHQLEGKVGDRKSRVRIAKSLRNWKTLAQFLPGIENDIESIEYDNHNLELQK